MTVTVPLHKALARIVELVAQNWAVKPAAITASAPQRGDRWACEARDFACYLAHKHLPLTQGQVGKYLGGRGHSTVTHAVARAADAIKTKPGYRAYLKRIEAELETTINR